MTEDMWTHRLLATRADLQPPERLAMRRALVLGAAALFSLIGLAGSATILYPEPRTVALMAP